jgi:hypothetical protein
MPHKSPIQFEASSHTKSFKCEITLAHYTIIIEKEKEEKSQ